jgi:hypothetical protein
MKNVFTYDKFITEMARPRDPNKPKRGFLDGYKTYDPSISGYGSPDKWKDAFDERMDRDTAKRIVADKDPYFILGIPRTADKY